MLIRSCYLPDQNLPMASQIFESKNKIIAVACSELHDLTPVMDMFQIPLLPLPTLARNTGLLGVPQRQPKCKIVQWCSCLEKKLVVPQNVKHRVTILSSDSTARYALKIN